MSQIGRDSLLSDPDNSEFVLLGYKSSDSPHLTIYCSIDDVQGGKIVMGCGVPDEEPTSNSDLLPLLLDNLVSSRTERDNNLNQDPLND